MGSTPDWFSKKARKTLVLAQEEALRLNHNYVGTEHLLLGLIRLDDGIAATALKNMGYKLSKIKSAVEFIIGCGDSAVSGDIDLTDRAKKVVEFAHDERRGDGVDQIDTGHLLLGLMKEGEGIAAGVLESCGLRLGKVRSEVISTRSEQRTLPAHLQLDSLLKLSDAQLLALMPVLARAIQQRFGS